MDTLNMLFKEGLKSLFKEELKDIVKEALREMTSEGPLFVPSTPIETVLLDRKEAAKLLNISLPTLDLYSKEGVINARRIGKKILYRKDELITAGKKVALNKYKRKPNA
jgi:excisionase family DNA binding protein